MGASVSITDPPEGDPASATGFPAAGTKGGGVNYVYCWITNSLGDPKSEEIECDVSAGVWECEFGDGLAPTGAGEDDDVLYAQGWIRAGKTGGTDLTSQPLRIDEAVKLATRKSS